MFASVSFCSEFFALRMKFAFYLVQKKNYSVLLTQVKIWRNRVQKLLYSLYIILTLRDGSGTFGGFFGFSEFAVRNLDSGTGFHGISIYSVSYTHLRAHETSLHLVCRLLLEKKKKKKK
eukprot:TRINITY_DN22358_c0_g1_i1.p3 TRINITY_DN22358_c0_g1~~TRINITY_DN22358_c0_g1_i1.p3  ORF type:complete len:119 (-),score=18.81 TRINITY_DN22358_c0_g1_i1:39-395(-)